MKTNIFYISIRRGMSNWRAERWWWEDWRGRKEAEVVVKGRVEIFREEERTGKGKRQGRWIQQESARACVCEREKDIL